MADFLVRRDDLRTTRVRGPEDGALNDGEARLRMERFGFTANNVTYGAFGEQMGYWRFFPAEEGWGRIPVWGFGEVIESQAAGIEPGQRFYGYFPMSSTVTMRPRAGGGASRTRPSTAPACRRPTTATSRPRREAGFARRARRRHGGHAPAVHDRLADRAAAGDRGRRHGRARERVEQDRVQRPPTRSSQLDDAPAVIGLTSARNADFVRSLGFYDTVLTYDEADQLPRGEGLRYVDMAGDADLRRAVHEHLGDDLRASIVVGATHWDHASLDAGGGAPGPGARVLLRARGRRAARRRARRRRVPAPDRRRLAGRSWSRSAGSSRSRSTAAPRPSSACTARSWTGRPIRARVMC